ncbi:hypothetical protein DFQ30_009028 [Apophysomyces sp. BC1015]|nr:hypothetical protein DFQ30_009028 [Apophysomyces sp. BC1015]
MVELHAFNDPRAQQDALSQAVGDALQLPLAARTGSGRVTLAVSGGTSPRPFLQTLARCALDWTRIDVTLLDDRWVPPGHADSNACLVRDTLLRHAARDAAFRPLVDVGHAPADCVAALNADASRALPDVAVLGMGEDGHTASIFADAPQWDVATRTAERYVLVEPRHAPHVRVSLSLSALTQIGRLFLLISGQRKLDVLRAAIEHPQHNAISKLANDTGVKTLHPDGPRLLADIGGTHARFALELGVEQIGDIRVYPCADYPGIADALRKFLKDSEIGRVSHAAIAIANPVDGDRVRMTNHNWRFSIEATRRALGFDALLVVNDFTALAMALPGLTDAQRAQIGGGVRWQHSGRWIALGSEGGHATFSPQDEREDLVMHYARKKWPHVSFERVCAGPGLELIYRALAARDKKWLGARLDPAEVVRRAQVAEPLALEAVECFCSVLGTFAGNIAVMLGALGGIYIGGGRRRAVSKRTWRTSQLS